MTETIRPSFELTVHCRHRFASGFEIDVDFASDAATTALFGPSGSGKTSILMMIAGFLTPTVGHITCNDHVLLDTDGVVRVRPEARRLGVVFQDQR